MCTPFMYSKYNGDILNTNRETCLKNVTFLHHIAENVCMCGCVGVRARFGIQTTRLANRLGYVYVITTLWSYISNTQLKLGGTVSEGNT